MLQKTKQPKSQLQRIQGGFTFLELAIVILVIGLIIGGVLAGQALLKSSQLRSITNEANAYNQAVMTFRSKYQALPGDMSDATAIWGVAHATPTTCATTAGTGKRTCNGDGNGRISELNGTDDWERARFWQHLQNADIVSGTLSGTTNGSSLARFSSNMPRSKYEPAGWTVNYMGWGDGTVIFAGATKGKHALLFGGEETAGWNTAPALTAQDAWAIDNKIDNGMSGSGKILTNRNSSPFATTPDCSTTDVQTTAEYNMTLAGVRCVLFFVAEF